MAERLLVRGGRVLDPERRLDAVRDILIEDGRVAEVAAGLSRRSGLKGVPQVAAEGLWVLPGLVDMHVHLREPGREGDETIASGARAAAAGGFSAVLAMPNTEPPVDNPSLLSLLRGRAEREAACEVHFAAAVTLGQKGERLCEFARLKDAGARALSDDGRPIMDAGLLRRALECAKDLGLLLIDHCEDLSLSAGACVHEGPKGLAKGLRGAPWAAETVQVVRDIALAELTGARVHLAHLSAEASVEAVRQAKRRGVPVSAEASPHHLALHEGLVPGYDGDWKMNPPLREERDRLALVEGLRDGTIDAIASDHAPHGCAAKSLGADLAPFGVIGLETSLAVALTELHHRAKLAPLKLAERLSSAPARLLGLAGRGTLARASVADLVLVDPARAWTPEPPFASKSRNTPFRGRRLKGRAVMTLRRGRPVHAL